tara:strand:- start:522 stop:1934 length:1413 start_codon:yes stop_codon:yes gene_type:complete
MDSGFFGKVGAYGISQVVVAGTGAIGVLFTTRFLSDLEFGLLDTAVTVFYWCIIVFGCGGSDPMTRYFSLSVTVEEKGKIVSSWMVFHVASFLLMYLIIIYGQCLSKIFPGDENHLITIKLILGLSIVVSITNSMLQLLRFEQKTINYMVAEIAMALMTLIAGVSFLFHGLGLFGWVLASSISAIITMLVLIWINRKWVFNVPEIRTIKRLVVYGLPLVPSYMFWYAMLMVDRLMLRNYDKNQVAWFVLAFKLTLLVKLVNAAFGMAWGPRAMEIYKESTDKVSEKYSMALSGYLVISLTLALIICSVAPNIIHMAFPEIYISSAAILPILMIPIIAEGTTFITGLSFGIKEKTKWIIFPPLAGLSINILLNSILIPQYGGGGAALASAISFMGLGMVYFILGNKLIKLSIPARVKYLALAVLIGLMLFVVAPDPERTDTLIRLAVLVAICAGFYRIILKELTHSRIAIQ